MQRCLLGGAAGQDSGGPILDEEGGSKSVPAQDGQM